MCGFPFAKGHPAAGPQRGVLFLPCSAGLSRLMVFGVVKRRVVESVEVSFVFLSHFLILFHTVASGVCCLLVCGRLHGIYNTHTQLLFPDSVSFPFSFSAD
jgi:hypothetical protein